MRIEYAGDPLADDLAGDFIIPGVNRSHARVIQTDVLAGAEAEASRPRGNIRNTISFVVDREHADMAAAAVYLLATPDSLPGQGALRISEGIEAYEMADACLVSAELVLLTGRSTQMRFTFTGGAITQTV
jgi:hypothetical protein